MQLSNLSYLVNTEAISEPVEEDDGLRYFIVRYPVNVGRGRYLQWIPEVAPSPRLLKLFKSRMITWKAFFERYVREMHAIPEAQKKIVELRELIKQGQKITLLCFESEWRHDCHRHILKDIILEAKTESNPDSHLNMSHAELLSYIPRQKAKENQALLEAEHRKISDQVPNHCYYCPFDKFTNKRQYQRHVILNHSGKPCYPGISDLNLLGQNKAQNMPWEI